MMVILFDVNNVSQPTIIVQFVNCNEVHACFVHCCRGIKLIERNEEVCVFYEKVNIQGNYNSV